MLMSTTGVLWLFEAVRDGCCTYLNVRVHTRARAHTYTYPCA